MDDWRRNARGGGGWLGGGNPAGQAGSKGYGVEGRRRGLRLGRGANLPTSRRPPLIGSNPSPGFSGIFGPNLAPASLCSSSGNPGRLAFKGRASRIEDG